MADNKHPAPAEANDLPSLSIRQPVLIVVLNILIAIAGIAAIMGVEVRELPDVDRPVVTVRANLPGGAPETVDAEVTSVLEGAAARVSGLNPFVHSPKKTPPERWSNFVPVHRFRRRRQ